MILSCSGCFVCFPMFVAVVCWFTCVWICGVVSLRVVGLRGGVVLFILVVLCLGLWYVVSLLVCCFAWRDTDCLALGGLGWWGWLTLLVWCDCYYFDVLCFGVVNCLVVWLVLFVCCVSMWLLVG